MFNRDRYCNWVKSNIAPDYWTLTSFCYTEDKVLVYNLFVSNIPKCIKEEDLQEYFSKFGDINSVTIVQRRKTKGSFRYAFVNFKKAESAKIALDRKIHRVQGKCVKVKPADSWKQPTTEQASNKNDDTNNNDNNDVNVPPILTLNDDCLLYLFTFLTLSEIIKMSDVCERFYTIFETIFKTKKSLDFNEFRYLSLMEVRQIVIKIGYLIESITCRNKNKNEIEVSCICGRHRRVRVRPSCVGKYKPNNQQRFIEFLPDFCQNLKVLQLKYVNNVHPDTFRRIGLNLKLIKKLELINCDINDQICLYLSELQNIEILNLSGNLSLTGKHLHKFTKLKQLSLNNCRKIQEAHFIELCFINKSTLKELHISNCSIFDENTYEFMATILINLEILTIRINDQATKLTKLADLKYLKNLTIFNNSVMKDDLFVNLSNKTEHTLEKLCIFRGGLNNKIKSIITSIKTIKHLCTACDPEIDDEFLSKCSKCSLEHLCVISCKNITKNGIIELLKRSDSLKVLNISFCSQFDNNFIFKVFDVLKMKGRREPYKLIVGETKISSSILKDPKYIEHRRYVQLSFNKYYQIL